ncbi:PREDICTED: protein DETOXIFICATION 51-like [Nelumbo nucifera]|uniref:Protein DETOXIFICATION n=1 Tax=Nelumbo nucifera TaxID=4432 RepID=A0A1U7ZDT4_NELNU|nr:PREDICTED: protein DETOXIFICATION 51-like [Nelumbo nucifera]
MCSPNSTTTSTTAVVENPAQPSNTKIYLAFVSLPPNNTNDDPENPKPAQEKQTQFPHHTISDIITEANTLINLSFPIALTALLLYSRSILSMLFLGHLGDIQLAAGSLAIAFANITGYSVLSGLALGMEPLCAQAFGAQRPKLLALTLHRSVIFLLFSSIPISLLWLSMSKLLLCLHQDPEITNLAQSYLLFSLPDLLTNSFLHPVRIYLRAQGLTHPLTLASLAGAIFLVPTGFLLVYHLQLGIAGVAIASAASNLFALLFLVGYVRATGLHLPTWITPSRECLTGWEPLLRLAGPSCVSVCLEWWWYEIIIVLCGLLTNPKATVASMGVLIQTTALIYVFPSSLGFAVSTRVGNELGANRPNKARVSAAVAVLVAFMMGVSATAFTWGMRNKWGRMFTSDVEILRLTSAALPILGLCEIGNCPQTVGCGVLRGTARPTTAANVNLGAFYVVGMPVAIGLGFWVGVGFCGLWLGLLSAQVCCAGLMLYVVWTTDWDAQAKRAQLLTCAVRGEVGVGGDSVEEKPLISTKLKLIV